MSTTSKKPPKPEALAKAIAPSTTTYNIKNTSGTKIGMSIGGKWIEVLAGQTIQMAALPVEATRLVGLKKLSLV